MATVLNQEIYSLVNSQGLAARLLTQQRKRMFDCFMAAACPTPDTTVLEIGVTNDLSFQASNHLLSWYPYSESVTGVGLDIKPSTRHYYKSAMIEANGKNLPLEDNSYDWVHSNAVIEHTGSQEEQTQFIKECYRVARKGVFITTPSRSFPIELHTSIPLMHWLPKSWHRAFLRVIGQGELAREENLNLLSRHELSTIVRKVTTDSMKITHVNLFGLPSNLILKINK